MDCLVNALLVFTFWLNTMISIIPNFNLKRFGYKVWIPNDTQNLNMSKFKIIVISPNMTNANLEDLSIKILKKPINEFTTYKSAEDFYQQANKNDKYCIFQVVPPEHFYDVKYYLSPEQNNSLNIGIYLAFNNWDFLNNKECIKQVAVRLQQLANGMIQSEPQAIYINGTQEQYSEPTKEDELYDAEVRAIVVSNEALTNAQIAQLNKYLQQIGVTKPLQNITNVLDVDWDNLEDRVIVMNFSDNPFPLNHPPIYDKVFHLLDLPNLDYLNNGTHIQLYSDNLIEDIDFFKQGAFDLIDDPRQVSVCVDDSAMYKYEDEQKINIATWEKLKRGQSSHTQQGSQVSTEQNTANSTQPKYQAQVTGSYQQITDPQAQLRYQQQTSQANNRASTQASTQRNAQVNNTVNSNVNNTVNSNVNNTVNNRDNYNTQANSQQHHQANYQANYQASNQVNNIYRQGKSLALIFVGIAQTPNSQDLRTSLVQFFAENNQVAYFDTEEQAYYFARQYTNIIFNIISARPFNQAVINTADFNVGLYIICNGWHVFEKQGAVGYFNQLKQQVIDGNMRIVLDTTN